MNLLSYLQQYQTQLAGRTLEHLWLVALSIGIAALIGIPSGVLLTRRPTLKRWVLGVANTAQTIPSLALFGFLIPLPWIGGSVHDRPLLLWSYTLCCPSFETRIQGSWALTAQFGRRRKRWV